MTSDAHRGGPFPTIHDVEQEPGTFAAFRVPGFPRIWCSLLSGNAGRFSILVVAAWEAFRLTRSAFWPSVIAFCILIPVAVVGPVAGTVADRVNLAMQMAAGQGLAAASALVASAFSLAHALSLPVLVGTTIGVGVGNAIQNPAWSSLVPSVIGVQRMVNGSAMVRIAQQGAEFVGPVFATPLLAVAGPTAVYLLSTALYLTGAGVAIGIRRFAPPPLPNPRRVLASLAEAVRYVSSGHRSAGVLLVLVGLHCGLTMAYTGIVPKVATVNLHGDSSVYGSILTAVGLGAIAGAGAVIVLARRLELRFLLVVTAFGSGLSLAVLGFGHEIAVTMIGAVLVGGTQSAFMALYLALLQGSVAPEMRGRVAAFSNILVGSTMSSAALVWGALVRWISPDWVTAAPGFLFVMATLVALTLSAWLRPPSVVRLQSVGAT
jgi:MFS family permease